LNDWCGCRRFDRRRSGSFDNRYNRCNSYFNNGRLDGRLGCFIRCLLCRRLLGGLFFFDRSDLTYETSGFGFALEHWHECFNQS
jgi:hypothetical protein